MKLYYTNLYTKTCEEDFPNEDILPPASTCKEEGL